MEDAGQGARILLVEDDESLGAGLLAALAAASYEIRWARDLAAAQAALAGPAPDLLLLDLGLPDGDGLRLCAAARAAGQDLVVVVLTARTDEADAVAALDAGADDYVTKPFRTDELLARLRAHLRRRDGREELQAAGVRLDLRARRAWYADVELALRPKELELLAALVAAGGEAVRRERLMDEVWDEHWDGSTKTLDVHVANLRRKLADAGDRWDRIATLRGFGYRFDIG